MSAPVPATAQEPSVQDPVGSAVQQRVLELARSPSKTVVEVAADPGMGKTTMLFRLAEAARVAGTPVVFDRCPIDAGDEPLAVFALAIPPAPKALPSEVSGPGALTPRGADGAVTLDSVHAWLAALAAQDAILMFDDVHRADAATLAVFDEIVQGAVVSPTVVLAHRPRQAPDPLRASLSYGLRTGTVERIEIPPWSLRECAELLRWDEYSPSTQRLHRESGGNPTYLLTLARAGWLGPEHDRSGWEHVPQDLRQLLVEDLQGLDARDRVVAAAAAVLGPEFDVSDLASVAERNSAETYTSLSTLVRRDIVRTTEEPWRFRFRHPVVREAVHETLGPAELSLLHRRADRALAERGAPAQDRALHVEHCLSDPVSADGELLVEAARATIVTSPRQAARWLEAARYLLHTDDFETLYLLVRAYALAGRLSRSRVLLHQMLADLTQQPSRIRTCVVGYGALVESLMGHYAEGVAMLTRELESARCTDPTERIELVIRHGFVAMLGQQFPTAADVGWALDAARDQGDDVLLVGALALRALTSSVSGDLVAANETLDECIGIVDSVSDLQLLSNPEYLCLLGWAEGMMARYTDAERHLRRGADICEDTGQYLVLPLILAGVANNAVHIGHLSRALRSAQRATEMAASMGAHDLSNFARSLEALCIVWMEPDGARPAIEIAERALGALPLGSEWASLSASYILALACRFDGRNQYCERLVLDAGRGPDLPMLHRSMRPMYYEMLTAAAVAEGDAAAAERWAAKARDAGQAIDAQRAFALASTGHSLRVRGRHEEACGMYQQAAALFSQEHLVRAQSWMLLLACECALERGDAHTAGSLLPLAVDLSARCGAGRLQHMADGLRERVTGPEVDAPDQIGGPQLDVLTERQREIALLVGQGHRSRTIAETLGLAPRTVDLHISRIYQRLGINSRAELAALVTRAARR